MANLENDPKGQRGDVVENFHNVRLPSPNMLQIMKELGVATIGQEESKRYREVARKIIERAMKAVKNTDPSKN